MEFEIATTAFAPVFWGMVALMLVFAGVILASVDPEITETYFGNPPWLIASVGIALLALATVALTRPEISAGVRALLSN